MRPFHWVRIGLWILFRKFWKNVFEKHIWIRMMKVNEIVLILLREKVWVFNFLETFKKTVIKKFTEWEDEIIRCRFFSDKNFSLKILLKIFLIGRVRPLDFDRFSLWPVMTNGQPNHIETHCLYVAASEAMEAGGNCSRRSSASLIKDSHGMEAGSPRQRLRNPWTSAWSSGCSWISPERWVTI